MNLPENRNSYGQILKSTTLIGGSQVISILLGIVRTKVLAVLLGPIGIGLLGVYNSLTQVIISISGLGVGSSAVREVAAASKTGDQVKISRTIFTLRRISLFLGILGGLTTILLSGFLSRLSFGSKNYKINIAALSVTICFAIVTAGQTALLQGLRRISNVATLNVLGSLFGTICSLPMVYFWGQDGIVPFLITVAGMNLLTSWWFARKVPILNLQMKSVEIIEEGRGLIYLGLAFMGSGLVSQGAAYIIRIILLRQLGLDGVGLYQAAFNLSSIYIGVILSAMGLDYYPRLTAVSDNNHACNQLINQQTEVGLLVAAPGIIATLSFAPFILEVFYSAKFIAAYGILRWSILGIFLRVVSWPLGYLILAKGRAMLFFITELAANVMHLILIWIATKMFGLNGTGIAFFGLYVFYTIMTFAVGYKLSGFLWSARNLFLIVIISVSFGLSIVLSVYLSQMSSLISGAIFTGVIAICCFRRLYGLVGREWFSVLLIKLKERFFRTQQVRDKNDMENKM